MADLAKDPNLPKTSPVKLTFPTVYGTIFLYDFPVTSIRFMLFYTWLRRSKMAKFLGAQIVNGTRYEYFADSSLDPQNVNQYRESPNGIAEFVGLMCSYPAWERSMHKIVNA
jgi:hypothetical protein